VPAVNSRLIYADITGSGSNGPEADKPGFDITAYWAGSLRKAPALVPLHRSNI
jgi:crotonobetainyl-CoA:carnitine CoA-transferase CaiB-like acyl-CoA transferase